MTTKEQEKKALEQIRKIVEGLGENSYVGTAFEGCFEIADENIRNDWGCSMKQNYEKADEYAYELYNELRDLKVKLHDVEKKAEKLQSDLDKELDWHDCKGGTNMSQKDYEHLLSSGRQLTEDEAKELVHDEFGFDTSKIKIITTVKTYQANKHRLMRVKDTFERTAVYDATDWNYVRFDCAGWMYEMINGMLCPYEC